MDKLISLAIPALLLAYYLKTILPNTKNKAIPIGMLTGGALLFYLGIFLDMANPAIASILKLAGACLFFTCVALNIMRSKEKTPDQGSK